jgi:hypothetical protein
VTLDGDAEQEGSGKQDESDMAVPAHITAHFIVVESEGFASLQVLFDMKACPDGLHHGGQGCVGWGPDQVIGQLVRVVQAAAHDEPMAPVHGAGLHEGQASPVKEALAFGALAW